MERGCIPGPGKCCRQIPHHPCGDRTYSGLLERFRPYGCCDEQCSCVRVWRLRVDQELMFIPTAVAGRLDG
jgi:hypothetical protein